MTTAILIIAILILVYALCRINKKEEPKQQPRKVYISGRITGISIKDAYEKFENAELRLSIRGFVPVNPMKIATFCESKKWTDYMLDDIDALFKCDAILMLDCWSESDGAKIERQIARNMGIKICYGINDLIK